MEGDVVGRWLAVLWVMGIWEFASCQAFVWSPGQQPEGFAEKAKNATKKVEKNAEKA